MSIENPQIGEICKGYELRPNTRNYRHYQWTACVDCGKFSWKVMCYGKVLNPRCAKCGHVIASKNKSHPDIRTIVKNNGYTDKLPLLPSDYKPKIGEFRYAEELGIIQRGNRGAVYIWWTCEVCEEARWVITHRNNTQPLYTKCNICTKKGRYLPTSFAETRTCNKCGKEYPATPEYFYKAPGGLKMIAHVCRWCRNKQVAKNTQHRLDTNITFKIHCNVSKTISASLSKNGKGGSWEKLVGYTTKELMAHLESLFTEGMSWDNYGRKGWVIDHIIPQSAFCYTKTTDIDFKRCWALSNLQPLFWVDNSIKHNKVSKPFQPSLPITISERKHTYIVKTIK